MDERFEVELTRPDYVVGLHSLTGELARTDRTAKRRLVERLAAFTLLLIAVGWLQPRAMMGIFWLIIGFMLIEWLMARRWTHAVHGVSFDPSVGPAVIHLTDDGITETSARRTRQWRWEAVRRIHNRETAVVFELEGWDMLVLPDRLWPDAAAKLQFLTAALKQLPNQSDDALSTMDLPGVMTSDLFRIAAFGAFIDACLLLTIILPPLLRPLARDIGVAGLMIIVMVFAAALGFLAYRAAEAALPRIHAASPLAAKIVAQCLIWAFAVWFGLVSLKLI